MKNKNQKAKVAMTAILTGTIVMNPMVINIKAQESDTPVLEQQNEQEEQKVVQGENTEQDKETLQESNPVLDQKEETTKKEVTTSQPETKQASKMMSRSTPVPRSNDIEINEINFPDDEFRNWLKQQPYGQDGILTKNEIANVTSIDVNSEFIEDLTGIGYFTALTELNCQDAGITTLDVSNNKALEILNCLDTKITSLDVSNNKALTTLICGVTQIGSLDVSNNTSLAYLDCRQTQIGSLDVSNNTSLTYLDCRETQIGSLDVSNNMSLIYLDCSSTGITSLDVSKNIAIIELICSGTGITGLDLNNNMSLTKLICHGTGITTLDVSNNMSLKELRCSYAGIKSLDVSNNLVLETLYCNNNSLAYLNIGNNLNLTYINKKWLTPVTLEVMEDTFKITDKFEGIDKSKIKNVTGADYDSSTGVFSNYVIGTPITYEYDCGTSQSGSETLSVSLDIKDYIDIDEAHFPDEQFRDWLKQQPYGQDGELTVDDIANITEINFNGKTDIIDLTGIEYFTALEKLYCDGTGITKLDVSKNVALTNLDCSGTEIAELDVSKNTVLTYLGCSSTGITELDVSKNTALTYLNCSSTGITELDVSKNTALINLSCSDTDITKLDVSKNTALKYLSCSGTGITELDVSKNTVLTYLGCYDTDITELDVSKNTALTILNCSGTDITKLDVSKNTVLTNLGCSFTDITELDVSKNTALIDLNCTGTKIMGLDVSKNIALTNLSYKNCPLSWLNIGTNTSLYLNKYDPIIELVVTEDTFKITDKFDGINKAKIMDVTGADYNKMTGVFSNYAIGTPITYKYDCGTSAQGSQILQVTLKLKGISTISITGTLDKTYDDTAVNSSPAVKTTGSKGTITYKWEKKISDGKWETVDSVPKDAGIYRVTAELAADDNYKGASSEPKEFTISKADSTVTITGTIDKTFDDTTVNSSPAVQTTGSKGTITYTWEKKISDGKWETVVSVPKDAGTYRVTAELASDDNYKGASSQPKEFTISKADGTVAITGTIDKTFDETAVNSSPAVRITGSKGTVTYTWEKKISDNKWETIVSAPKDAGTYRVTAELAADDNYKGASSEPKEFTIYKADSTVAITGTIGKTFDDNVVNSSPTVRTTGSKGTVTYTWEKKISDNKWETIVSAPKDAGTYRVTAELASDDNYKGASSEPKEFTISKADSTVVITGTIDKTFDDTAVNSSPAVKTTGSKGAVTYTWEKKISDSKWEKIVSAPKNAGTYRVTAELASDDNYKNATSTPVEFTITKAKNKWTTVLSIVDWAYQEIANAPSAEAQFGSPTFSYSDSENGPFIAVAPTAIGTWYVKAVVAGTDNYEELETVKSFMITKANSTISITETLDKTYDKAAVNARPAVKTTGSTGTITYTWEKKIGDGKWEMIVSAPTNAGTYRVKAHLASDDNYKEASSAPMEFTIKQGEPSYTVPTGLTVVYGQSLEEITLPDGFKWTDKDRNVGNVGDHQFTVTYTPNDSNYHQVKGIAVTLTVKKAENASTVKPTLQGWVYGGMPNKARAGFRFGTPRFLYSDKLDGTFTETVPTAAGTWYVKAVVDDTANYKGAESEVVSFTIEPKDATVDTQMAVPDITADKDYEHLTVKDGDKVLVQGRDYDVTKSRDKDKLTVTITFKGNYRGTITKTYAVGEHKPSDGTNQERDNTSDVNTGDTTNTGLWVSLLTLCGGMLALLTGKKHRKEEK